MNDMPKELQKNLLGYIIYQKMNCFRGSNIGSMMNITWRLFVIILFYCGMFYVFLLS